MTTPLEPNRETRSEQRAALVTPSYAGDFERCRLLCRTVDRHVSGADHHYVLVSGADVVRFRALEGPRRSIVDERDILPSWLHGLPDPFSLFRRHVWLSMRVPPLRGWHVQQLRRIAIARHVSQSTLVYCDSDVVFLKPFDLASFRREGNLRLYRREGALQREGGEHLDWFANAGKVLGLPEVLPAPSDYISTVIAWSRDRVLAMLRHIEAGQGRDWVTAIARRRRFSECLIYGRYVDEVLQGAGHFHDDTPLCRVYWSGPELGAEGLEKLAASMTPEQVAIGIQSFTGTDLDTVRRFAGV